MAVQPKCSCWHIHHFCGNSKAVGKIGTWAHRISIYSFIFSYNILVFFFCRVIVQLSELVSFLQFKGNWIIYTSFCLSCIIGNCTLKINCITFVLKIVCYLFKLQFYFYSLWHLGTYSQNFLRKISKIFVTLGWIWEAMTQKYTFYNYFVDNPNI